MALEMRTVPFTPSKNNYRLVIPLDNVNYIFDNIHWNGTDPSGSAWYFDLREEDETLIAAGLKLVLNGIIGRTNSHSFFDQYVLRVIDTSSDQKDPGLDDLGGRIQLVIIKVADL